MVTPSVTLCGAGLACALGGAVAGSALGSSPILDRGLIGTFYQSDETPAFHDDQAKRPPDHYPLVTARGIVPVEELSERGLFSQARYRPVHADIGYDAAAFAEAEYVPEPDEPRFGEREDSDLVPEPPTQAAPAQAQASPPLQLAKGPVAITMGQAKTIDVSAALAMQ